MPALNVTLVWTLVADIDFFNVYHFFFNSSWNSDINEFFHNFLLYFSMFFFFIFSQHINCNFGSLINNYYYASHLFVVI